MKKYIGIFLALFISFSAFSYSPSFSFALGSGFGFYGDTPAKERKEDNNLANQLNLYFDANFNLFAGNYIFFNFGVDSFCSWVWDGAYSHNIADVGFNAGINFYPGLYGLILGIDYSLCNRTDYIDIKAGKWQRNSDWGSGFKISAEYDFFYSKRGFSPVLGTAWRFMPRGDGIYDNFLLFYVRLLKK